MTNFRDTTDASGVYRPTSAGGAADQCGTAANGNLSDLLKNSTTYRLIPSTTTTVLHTTITTPVQSNTK
jgi:hypothetical protein